MNEPVSTQILPEALQREREVQAPVRAKRRRRWVLPLAGLLVLGGVGYAAWRFVVPHAASPNRPRGAGAQPPQPVGAAAAGRADVRVILNALGTVTPLATVTVKTQINGQLMQVAFKEGQIVQKGDFLAQIDPRPYQVALENAQGALARDQALLKNAQLDLARYRTLVAQDSGTRQQADTQASLVQQYIGTVKTDQAAIDSANLNLTYCHITAPVSGRVGLRQVDEGNYVQTSDAGGIVVITQLQPISVLFALPEDNVPEIQRQADNGTGLPVTALDRADAHEIATGRVETVDNQIDTTTGTVRFRAVFDNTDGKLFPNQFVNIRLLVETLRGVETVPQSAVQQGEPGTFVYLVRPDNTVHVQPVKLGPSDNGKVQVVSGLQDGDQVVTDGADRLREEAKVTIPAPGGNGSGNGGRQRGQGAGEAVAPAQQNADQQNGDRPNEGERRRGRRGQQQGSQPAPP